MGWGSGGQDGTGGGGGTRGIMEPVGGVHWLALSYRLRCGAQRTVRQVYRSS